MTLKIWKPKVPSSKTASIMPPFPAIWLNVSFRPTRVLESKTHPHVRIAMRSSAVGEDTEASFAGQHITVLNVTKENILEAYKAVVASNILPGRSSIARISASTTMTPPCASPASP